MSKNGLIRKIRLISKFMTSQPCQQTIATHILTKFSRSKSNQAMFGQLIERNMRNAMERPFPDPFLKNQNWAYLWNNILKFHTACFYGMPSWKLSEHFETKLQATCSFAFTSYKAFLKNKRSGTSLPVSFSAWFLKKNISCYILLPGQISLSGYFVR